MTTYIRFRVARLVGLSAAALALTGCGAMSEPSDGDDVGFTSQAVTAVLSRGPYLQMGSSTAMTIRWRTDVATDTRVQYGTQVGVYGATYNNATLTTEHEARLTGLSPVTTYYYSIGSSTQTLAGGTADYRFSTSPVTGRSFNARIWVLGDSGTADNNARAVRDAFATYTGARGADLMLMLGDNAYDNGLDAEYQSAVFNTYPTWLRNTPLWSTLGNHDGYSANSNTQTGPYYNIFTLPRNAEAGGVASGTEAYYSWNYGNIHFVVLNSYDISRAPGGAMLTWLQNDLLANTATWTIAFWHHPPYTKGSHDSDAETELIQMRTNALPILEQNGVDLVLCGHSHSYERTFLLDGHYGLSGTFTNGMKKNGGSGRTDGTGAYTKQTLGPASHQGAVYVVEGASGLISGGDLDHPAMYHSANTLGSVVLDINGSRLDAKRLRSTGATTDYFTIIKGNCNVNGTACDDANACTLNDTCQNGSCVGGAPVTCVPQSQCHNAGTCNPNTGACTNPLKTNGAGCNDGNLCTQGDSCQSGVCTAGAPLTCPPSVNPCQVNTCAPGTGLCSLSAGPNGTACSDGNPCTLNDTCQAGVCSAGAPRVCQALDQCHVAGNCDPMSGTCSNPAKSDGVGCNDGQLCTGSDVCTAGVCAGAPVTCQDNEVCTDDSCNPATGLCVFQPNSQPGCAYCGNTIVDPGEECDDGNNTGGDGCNRLCRAELLFAPKAKTTFAGNLVIDLGDIVSWDFDDHVYRRFFDASSAGLPAVALGGFHRLQNGHFLFALAKSATLPVMGKAEVYDIIEYTPPANATPPYSGGTWSLYARLKPAGFGDGGSEKIDSISVLPNGHIVIGSTGSGTAGGVAFLGYDLIEFAPQSLGANPTGAWSMYFDASDVELAANSELADCGAVDSRGRITLSTTGNFAVTGLTGVKADVFVFTPTTIGDVTTGSYSGLYVGGQNGFTGDAAACYIGR